MSEQSPNDLLFAWLTPIETQVDKKIHRPRSPNLNSPLVRAKTAIRRTFSAGQKAQRHKEKVREALEASWWLRTVGFPQYAQLFDDGKFPLNISKIHVEKDHSFLDQTELDALIRRLNVLNRCTPLMEEITSIKKEGREEESVTRALSDRWVYQQKWHSWGRKSHQRRHSDGSTGGHLADTSLPTSHNAPLLISELRGSLTDLTREVKTYSFCPAEDDLPPIVVDPPGTTQYASTSSESPTKQLFPSVDLVDADPRRGSLEGEGVSQSMQSIDSEVDSETFDQKPDTFPVEMNFTTGLCSAFDSTLQKLRTTDQQRSHSLPNVFSSLGHEIIDTSCISTTTDENTSTSVSVASLIGDSTSALDEEPAIERAPTPERLAMSVASCVNGHDSERLQNHSYVRTSSASILPSSFRDGVDPPAVVTSTPKRWSGPGHMASGGYDSGSDIWDMDRDRRSRLSPLVDGWTSHSYAHPPRRSSADTGTPVAVVEPAAVRRRKQRNSISGRSKTSRWHSFQKRHCFQHALKPVRSLIPIEELSAGQISVLQKLSLVKLTAMLELYGSTVNIVRCLRRKHKLPEIKGKNK